MCEETSACVVSILCGVVYGGTYTVPLCYTHKGDASTQDSGHMYTKN